MKAFVIQVACYGSMTKNSSDTGKKSAVVSGCANNNFETWLLIVLFLLPDG